MKPRRLAIIMSHPTQHFAPLYAELAKFDQLQLKVFFIAENGVVQSRDNGFDVDLKWDIPLTQGYEHCFIDPGRVLKRFNFFTVDSRNLNPALEKYAPDSIWLHGYAQLANWRVLFKFNADTHIIYSSDSNFVIQRHWMKRLCKSILLPFFFKRVDRLLSISDANRAYLKHYGVADDKIVDTNFPIDIARITHNIEALPANSKQLVRRELGVRVTDKILIFVGKLSARKRAGDVISALSKLSDQSTHLVILGSGEQRPQLQQQASMLGVDQRVHFAGFVNQTEMAKYLASADVFVFPSVNEPYGAIASEVLPYGLPMVVAQGVGAIGRSVIDGVNALVFQPRNIPDLVTVLDRLIGDERLQASLAKQSKKRAWQHDKTVMANALVSIVCGR